MSGVFTRAARFLLCLVLGALVALALGCGARTTVGVTPPGGHPSGMPQIAVALSILRTGMTLQGVDLVVPNGGIMGQLDNVLVRDPAHTETVILPVPYPEGGRLSMRHHQPITLADRDGTAEIIIAINDADGLTLYTSATEVILLRGEIKFSFEIIGGRVNTFPSAIDRFILPTAGGTVGDMAFGFAGLPPGTRVQATISFQEDSDEQTLDHSVTMEDVVGTDGRADLVADDQTRVSRITGMTFTFYAP